VFVGARRCTKCSRAQKRERRNINIRTNRTALETTPDYYLVSRLSFLQYHVETDGVKNKEKESNSSSGWDIAELIAMAEDL